VDFIERWFGVSPDGGSGSLEMLYIAAIALVVGVILFRSRIKEFIARMREQLR
jgi:hypothetical protein